MTVTYTTSGGNSTLTAAYTGPTATMNAVLDDAAHGFWNLGMGNHADPTRTWASVTLTEKKDILDQAIKGFITRMAKDHHIVSAVESARATAVSEEGTYDI